jgi:hypothetical protein
MIEQSAIDLANDYLDAAAGSPDVALVMLAASMCQMQRQVSGGYVRARVHVPVKPPKPQPDAITDEWIATGKGGNDD